MAEPRPARRIAPKPLKLHYREVRLSEFDDDRFLGIQLDGNGGPTGGSLEPRIPTYEALHPYGFRGRPLDPEVDPNGDVISSCGALELEEGAQSFVIPLGDARLPNGIPLEPKGGSVQYAADGSFALFDNDTHTWTLYQPQAFSNGAPTKAHLITVGVDGNGKRVVEIVHADGMAVTMLDGSLTLKNNAGDAYVEINDDGIILNGNVKIRGALEANGATITPTGDVKTATGVSLMTHPHPTAMGPSGTPIPTP